MTTLIAKKIRSTSTPGTEYENSAANATNNVVYKSSINKKNLKLNIPKKSENWSRDDQCFSGISETNNASQDNIFKEIDAESSKNKQFFWPKRNHESGANNSKEMINKAKDNNEYLKATLQDDDREAMEISPPSNECFDDDDDFIVFEDLPGKLSLS